MYDPQLKTDHQLPAAFRSTCTNCFQRRTLFVSEAAGFAGFRCSNKRCQAFYNLQQIQCCMEWRERNVIEISRTLGDVAAMIEDPVRGLVPDFSNPVYDPKLSLAPHRRCEGQLQFNQGTRSDYHPWLVCDKCLTRYRSTVLASWDANGKAFHHGDYYFNTGDLIERRPLVMPLYVKEVGPDYTMLIDIVTLDSGAEVFNPYHKATI